MRGYQRGIGLPEIEAGRAVTGDGNRVPSLAVIPRCAIAHLRALEARARNPSGGNAWGSMDSGLALCAPRNDGWRQLHDLATHGARALPGISVPSKTRGRREDRVRAAPTVSCAKWTKESAHEHTGSAESIRPSLRNGFTAYIVISPVGPGSLSPSSVEASASHELDASIGASGPHDFAVRSSRDRQSQLLRPPHPTARS